MDVLHLCISMFHFAFSSFFILPWVGTNSDCGGESSRRVTLNQTWLVDCRCLDALTHLYSERLGASSFLIG